MVCFDCCACCHHYDFYCDADAGGAVQPYTLVSNTDPASTQELASLVEDVLTVPGSELDFDRTENVSDDEVQFAISKPNMEKWLRSCNVLDPNHAPLSVPNESSA